MGPESPWDKKFQTPCQCDWNWKPQKSQNRGSSCKLHSKLKPQKLKISNALSARLKLKTSKISNRILRILRFLAESRRTSLIYGWGMICGFQHFLGACILHEVFAKYQWRLRMFLCKTTFAETGFWRVAEFDVEMMKMVLAICMAIWNVVYCLRMCMLTLPVGEVASAPFAWPASSLVGEPGCIGIPNPGGCISAPELPPPWIILLASYAWAETPLPCENSGLQPLAACVRVDLQRRPAHAKPDFNWLSGPRNGTWKRTCGISCLRSLAPMRRLQCSTTQATFTNPSLLRLLRFTFPHLSLSRFLLHPVLN